MLRLIGLEMSFFVLLLFLFHPNDVVNYCCNFQRQTNCAI